MIPYLIRLERKVLVILTARYKDIIDIEGIRRSSSASGGELVIARKTLNEKLSRRFAVNYVYLFSSRRAALNLLLRALDIGGKDEVVIPALTDPTLADSVLSRRSVPHLADIDPEHMAMKASSLRRILAKGRTRMVIDAPLGGSPYGSEAVSAAANDFGVPFVVDISRIWPTKNATVAPDAAALVMSLASSYPLVTAKGGVLAVRDERTARIIESLIVDIPRVGKEADETALKGLLVQNRLLSKDIYDGDVPENLGYLYARKLGDSLETASIFDDDYIEVAAQEALAERAGLTATPKVNLLRHFHRWIHPSTAVPHIEVRSMGNLSAAIANLHFDITDNDGERRTQLAKLYHSELVRLDQIGAVNILDETGVEIWPLHYPVLLGPSVSRSQAIRRCRRAGFEVGAFYYPRPLSGLFPYYKLCRHTAKYLRGAWRVASSLLNLPLHQEINDIQAARLVRALKGQ